MFDQYHLLLNHTVMCNFSSMSPNRLDVLADKVLLLCSLICTQFKTCCNRKKRNVIMLVHGLMLELSLPSDKISEPVSSDHKFPFNVSYTN